MYHACIFNNRWVVWIRLAFIKAAVRPIIDIYLVTWYSLSLEIVRYVRRTMDYSRWKMITRFRINYTHCSSHRYRYSIILFCNVLFTMIIVFWFFEMSHESLIHFSQMSVTRSLGYAFTPRFIDRVKQAESAFQPSGILNRLTPGQPESQWFIGIYPVVCCWILKLCLK